MIKEELDRICLNCSHFFPATMEEATEFGICLNDEAFEPFLDELLERSDYSSCKDLIDGKKFICDQEACVDFEQTESIEIDDSSPLGQELLRLSKTGGLNPESLDKALFEDRLRNIDWTTMPVDQYVTQLNNTDPRDKRAAISSLAGMITFGNKEAFNALFRFFNALPPPRTIDEVHFKKEILRYIERSGTRTMLLPHLIDELYRTPSNNTTRQWISDIFRFLEYLPLEEVREPVERMLKDKRFSYRLKQKMKNILVQGKYG